jgi:hypothetical protein
MLLLEEITICSIEVFKDIESNMAVGRRKLGNLTSATAKSNVIVQQYTSSYIFTAELQTTKSDL